MALHLQFGQLDKPRADIEEIFDDFYYTYTIIESTLGSLKDDLFFLLLLLCTWHATQYIQCNLHLHMYMNMHETIASKCFRNVPLHGISCMEAFIAANPIMGTCSQNCI